MPTYNANLLPNTTGLDLGSTSQRWDVVAQSGDFSTNVNVTGTLTTGAQTVASEAITGNATVGGTLGVTGVLTASSGVIGAVTGNTSGTHTGAVVGNVTGNLTGNVTGNVTGASTGAHNGTTGATTPSTGAFSTLTFDPTSAGGAYKPTLAHTTNITVATANANSTSAQDLMSASLVSGLISGIGKTIRIWASGTYTTQSAQTPTLTIGISYLGVVLATFVTGATTASQTDLPWNLSAYISATTLGAGGTGEAHGTLNARIGSGTGAFTSYGDGNASTVSIDTFDAATLKLQATFSTNAATANICKQRQFIVEVLN